MLAIFALLLASATFDQKIARIEAQQARREIATRAEFRAQAIWEGCAVAEGLNLAAENPRETAGTLSGVAMDHCGNSEMDARRASIERAEAYSEPFSEEASAVYTEKIRSEVASRILAQRKSTHRP